jgi:hypothetical protein
VTRIGHVDRPPEQLQPRIRRPRTTKPTAEDYSRQAYSLSLSPAHDQAYSLATRSLYSAHSLTRPILSLGSDEAALASRVKRQMLHSWSILVSG